MKRLGVGPALHGALAEQLRFQRQRALLAVFHELGQVQNGLRRRIVEPNGMSDSINKLSLRLFCSSGHQVRKRGLILMRNKYSRIRLYHSPPDRTKVADMSGWMMKLVGSNSSSKCQLYWENNQIR